MNKGLSQRSFILLEIGQFISQCGNGIFLLAFSWYVLSRPAGTQEFAVLMLLGAVPGLLLAPFFGVLVDRLSKRTILVTSDILRSFSFFLLSLVLTQGTIHFSYLAVFSFVNGVLFFIFDPTLKSSIPLIVDYNDLEKANSIDSAIASFSGLISMFIGGMLLAFFGVRSCFFINSVTFMISAFCALFVTIPAVTQKNGPLTIKVAFAEMKGTFAFISKEQNLAFLMLLGLILTAFIYPTGNVLFPILLKNIIQFKAIVFSMIQGGYPLGIIVGVFVCIKIKVVEKNIFTLVYFCGISMAIIILGWGAVARFYPEATILCAAFLMLSVVCMGTLTVIMAIKTTTYLQTVTPKQLLGKVISFYQMIVSAIVPIGYVVYSSVIISFEIKWVFVIISILVISLTTIVTTIRRSHLRKEIENRSMYAN